MVEYTSFSRNFHSTLKEVEIKLTPGQIERILQIYRDNIMDYQKYLEREEVKNNYFMKKAFKELLTEYEQLHQTIAGQVEDINTHVRLDKD
jgi:hypothetical protein